MLHILFGLLALAAAGIVIVWLACAAFGLCFCLLVLYNARGMK
jgi:hypothetical protein